jgi:hypothetical protein
MGKQSLSKATCDFASPHTANLDTELWEPCASDLKTYRHFDAIMSREAIKSLVRNPSAVAKHTFRPLLHFEKRWRRAPKQGVKRSEKVRPIRYACRKDAYIYKHYRGLLSDRYEKRLLESGLHKCVLAYRRIPVAPGADACKSNIQFADEAFKCIEKLGKCSAVAIDISDYFGSINHERLRQVWVDLLDTSALPTDHEAVFRSVTRYRYVDLNQAFVALGYSAPDSNGTLRFLKHPSKIPLQLCTPREFREKIVAADLVQKHEEPFGIPQGTPISDLLANAYLFEFDSAMAAYASERGGHYFRYSDDILLVLPGDGRAARGAADRAMREISKCGSELKINQTKTEMVCFTPAGGRQRCYTLAPREQGDRRFRKSRNEGLSYLGFRYDGESVYLRNSTISNLRGKIARTCKAAAHEHIGKHREKDLEWLLENLPSEKLLNQYLKVEDFEEVVSLAIQNGQSFTEHLTFWSYAKRAEKVFGWRGRKIKGQLRDIEPMIRESIDREVRAKFKVRQQPSCVPT